jgi:hypothetical protein
VGRRAIRVRRLLGGLALLVALVLVGAAIPSQVPRTEACAFLRSPAAYEADQTRTAYLAAIDAASINALFPGDPFFGLPAVRTGPRATRTDGAAAVPASLLRAIAWSESNLAMAAGSVPFQSTGPALVSFDCGYGLMQVTTGMTVPLGADNHPTANQADVAGHYIYNIARGAYILAAKWNEAPESRPIAGTDTGGDPSIIENWYYAVWSYNGFTGPGSILSNHPLDPRFSNTRPKWKCDGTQSRTKYPYQEVVWGCMASPPSVYGQQLWQPIPVSLPNLTDPKFAGPLALANFVFPYASMDMPTPLPSHKQVAPAVSSGFAAGVLGSPSLQISNTAIQLALDGGPQSARAAVTVENAGTGILVWMATPSAPWIVVEPPAGVALGSDVACTGTCSRAGTLTVTINPAALPQAMTSGSITVTAANGGSPPVEVSINASADFDLSAPGTSRAY